MPVRGIDEIRRARDIASIDDGKLLTNFYVGDESVIGWIERGQIFIFGGARTFLMLWNRKDFYHLYFTSIDPMDLTDRLIDLKERSNCTISVDLIGDCSEASMCFDRAGFERYISLTWMRRLNTPAPAVIADDDWFAAPHEAGAVEEILYENMDPLGEQIPDIEEIKAAIANRNILVARHGTEVSAFLFFNRTGVTVYLRFWAGRKKFRGLGYGGLVYNRYVTLNADARRFILWVRDDNEVVKKIYRTHGMSFENLHDEVRLSKGTSDMNNSIENDRLSQLRTDFNKKKGGDRLSVDEICRAKEAVEGNGSELSTNFFVKDDVLEKYIARNELKIHVSNKTLLIARTTDRVSRLYFATVDADDLAGNLKMFLPFVKRPIAVDIYKNQFNTDQFECLEKIFTKVGFKHYATQFRLLKVVNTNRYNAIDPKWFAKEEECDEIMEIIYGSLDYLCDQLPERDEMLQHIKNKEVLVYRRDGVISSVLVGILRPAVAEWTVRVTRPEYRMSEDGLLLRKARDEYTKDVRRQINYARKKRLLRIYMGESGAKPDGFENHVFVLNN